jgi:recombination protein RecR
MLSLPQSVQKLIRELSKLPSVGEKSATRLAYFLINGDRAVAKSLAQALLTAAADVRYCEECFFLSDNPRCPVCLDQTRDKSLLCVVEKPTDLIAIERSGEYRGVFHVLHGLWAPLRGQGPESIRVKELLARAKTGVIKEVIIATSSTVEGDATAMFLARQLGEIGVRSSRPAQGIPKGGELEYADDVTLSRAIMGRNVIAG